MGVGETLRVITGDPHPCLVHSKSKHMQEPLEAELHVDALQFAFITRFRHEVLTLSVRGTHFSLKQFNHL